MRGASSSSSPHPSKVVSTESKKLTPDITRHIKRPVSGLKQTAGSYHSKCCERPSSKETARPNSGKFKSPQQFSNDVTFPDPLRSQSAKSKLQGSKIPTKPKVSQPQKEIDQLTCKFEELAQSVLNLASSRVSLDVRSLESLLTKEIAESLGAAVNDAKFSQRFIQSTRELLDSLVCMYENGRINPQLIKDKNNTRQNFLRANPKITTCYRDQYFKELVMNVLQSMCSDDIEEETSQAEVVYNNDLLSAASRERIRVIRDIVRTEAGLEPETFQHVDQELLELQRIVFQNRLAMMKATKKLESTISEHLLTDSCKDFMTTMECLIPDSARSALKGSCDAKTKSTVLEKNTTEKKNNDSGCKNGCLKNVPSEERSSKNYLDNMIDNVIQDSLKFNRLDDSGGSDSKLKYVDLIESIKPQIETLVQNEILRLKGRNEQILNQHEKFDKVVYLKNSPNSPSGSLKLKNVDSDNHDGYKEKYVFLDTLTDYVEEKEKIIENMSCNIFNIGIFNSTVLDVIDEDDEETINEDTKSNYETKNYYVEQNQATGQTNSMDFGNRNVYLDDMLSKEQKLTSAPLSLCQTPNTDFHAIFKMRPDVFLSFPEMDKQVKDEIPPQCARSKIESTDPSKAKDIIKEMREAFDQFRVISNDKFTEINNIEQVGNMDKSEELPVFSENKFGFTIEEMTIILKNISIKLQELPRCLQAIDHKSSNCYQEQTFNILMALEHCLNDSNPADFDSVTPLKDEKLLSLSIDSISNTFLFLSEKLSHTPTKLKSQPITILSPPKSLTKTLTILASTRYFKNCFVFSTVKKNYSKSDFENYNTSHEYSEKILSEPFQNADNMKKESDKIQSNKELKTGTTYNTEQERPSEEIFSSVTEQFGDKYSALLSVSDSCDRNTRDSPEINKNLSKFEHYLGLTASVMTVQNVSDMFLFLSAVLNDVPDRIKSEKILSLDPPISLQRALNILYSADNDNCLINVDRKMSFSSLTVQNASDFFLTLSKTFQEAPPRVRNSIVLDLDPPESLLKAINLLTSLSHNSIVGSNSHMNVAENINQRTQPSCLEEAEDMFFDAVDSLT